MLPQIRHIIVKMFSSIHIVAVNTTKKAEGLGFKGKKKKSFQRHKKKISIKNIAENKIFLLCETNYKKYRVFLAFWWPFCVLLI